MWKPLSMAMVDRYVKEILFVLFIYFHVTQAHLILQRDDTLCPSASQEININAQHFRKASQPQYINDDHIVRTLVNFSSRTMMSLPRSLHATHSETRSPSPQILQHHDDVYCSSFKSLTKRCTIKISFSLRKVCQISRPSSARHPLTLSTNQWPHFLRPAYYAFDAKNSTRQELLPHPLLQVR